MHFKPVKFRYLWLYTRETDLQSPKEETRLGKLRCHLQWPHLPLYLRNCCTLLLKHNECTQENYFKAGWKKTTDNWVSFKWCWALWTDSIMQCILMAQFEVIILQVLIVLQGAAIFQKFNKWRHEGLIENLVADKPLILPATWNLYVKATVKHILVYSC